MIRINAFECLPCARLCTECFMSIFSFDPDKPPVRPHLTDGQTEAQRGFVKGHPVDHLQSPDSNSYWLDCKAIILKD